MASESPAWATKCLRETVSKLKKNSGGELGIKLSTKALGFNLRERDRETERAGESPCHVWLYSEQFCRQFEMRILRRRNLRVAQMGQKQMI